MVCAAWSLVPAARAQTAADLAEQAGLAAEQGDLRAAAEAYRQAALKPGRLADEYRLRAAEAALGLAEPALVEPYITPLLALLGEARLDETQTVRLSLAECRAALLRGRWFDALRALPQEGVRVAPAYAAEVEALRAQALFALGDPLAATRVLVGRESLLGGDKKRLADNHERIWQGLVATPLAEDARRLIAQQDVASRGWLELAWLMQQGERGFEGWQQQFPGHPAAARIGSIRAGQLAGEESLELRSDRPLPSGAVALLLPLSGPLAASAAALGDGFLAGYFASGRSGPAIRFYDSGSTPSETVAAYRQALADGAAAIVGPLQKESLAAIASLGEPPVPVIALNTLDSGVAPPGLFQLGLSPEDEAAAAAAQAASEGDLRALALVPQGEWGQRVLAAFSKEIARHGGRVVDSARYQSGTADPSEAVRDLMNLAESEARHRALTAVIGVPSEFQPRRRQDVDLVFVAANAADALILLPQLSFHRAGSLPVYTTALVYSGAGGVEVDRVRFCDMPWMIDRVGFWRDARVEAENLFAATARRQPRLFALGQDAWSLTQRVLDGRAQVGDRIEGATGLRVLQTGGQLSRELGCVELREHGLNPLQTLGPGVRASRP